MAKKPSPIPPPHPPAAQIIAGEPSNFAAAAEDIRPIGQLSMGILAIIVGVVTGFGAVLFRDLIGLIHNILFLGQFVVRYDANLFTPASPWGALVILVPVIGALAVTFLVTNFAPEARGHGVPEVMDAIYYKGGIIRPVVAVVKSLASAISIGSGAAVGREGPIIQIGSGLGSTLGQIVRMPAGQRIILVGAGAGAGIAATFNTPIGGVMFAIELMMPEVSVRTFLPVALATGTATFIGRFFFGPQPAFMVPHLVPMSTDASSAITLCLYALLGAITGIAAAGFIRGLHLAEDIFDKDQRTLHAARVRHAARRRPDLYSAAAFRPLLRARRRLCHGPGDSARTIVRRRIAVPALPLQDVGNFAQSRLRRVGGNIFTLALHGRDDRRHLCRAHLGAASAARKSTFPPLPWSAWERWSAAAPAR